MQTTAQQYAEDCQTTGECNPEECFDITVWVEVAEMIGIDVSQYVPRAATALYKAGVPFTDTTLETFDCGQLLPYCVDFGIRGKLARATCPVTCGCADLMSGNTLATSIHGCQLQCAAAQYLPLQQNNVSAIGFPGLNIRSTRNSLLHTSTFDVFSAVSTAIFASK